MKKFKVCLTILLIAMMMGGTAWAFNAKDHVKVAPNGKGDLLIFPYYFAYPGDFSTWITVINTSNTHSVVAKVIYRSYNWSFEVLDHLIYLSPNDVWTGKLVNVLGVARLVSNDDSILGVTPGALARDEDFGNITLVNQPLVPAFCVGQDENTMGYVEVIEAASRLETKATTGYEPGQRVAKRHIYDWYSKYVTRNEIQNGPYSPINVLTGYQENEFGTNNGSTLKQAVVFADYFNYEKLEIGRSTALGQNANNTLAEVEAAMAKRDLALPYIAYANGDSSVHIFNFPTKLSSEPVGFTCTGLPGYKVNLNSPYWTLVNNKCESYVRNIYDLSENTPVAGAGSPFSPTAPGAVLSMCAEVQFNVQELTASSLYNEGWIRYNFGRSAALKTGLTQSGAAISFTGTPVLSSALYWSKLRGAPAEANIAYTDGDVSVANVSLPYYQYAD